MFLLCSIAYNDLLVSMDLLVLMDFCEFVYMQDNFKKLWT